MSKKKPKVFVGSSSEAKSIAQEFCAALKDDATMIRWWRCGEFLPTRATFDAVLRIANTYDFGLFILTPDDDIVSRGKKTKCARDNVILELGCFLGTIGPDRTFAVIQDTETADQQIKLLSDLSGVGIPPFKVGDTDETTASIEDAVEKIRGCINGRGVRRLGRDLHALFVRSWDYILSTKTFSVELDAVQVSKYKETIIDGYFVLACRKRRTRSIEHDDKIAISEPRRISRTDTAIWLDVQDEAVFSEIEAGDMVDGALIFLPTGVDISTVTSVKTIAEMEKLDCEMLEVKGVCATN